VSCWGWALFEILSKKLWLLYRIWIKYEGLRKSMWNEVVEGILTKEYSWNNLNECLVSFTIWRCFWGCVKFEKDLNQLKKQLVMNKN
jgi:hypothetical protein